MSKRAEAAWVLMGFTALALITTYPIAFAPATTHIAGDAGDPLLSAWTLGWDANRFRHGLSGIWDAPSFFPYHHTLLYSDHLLGIAVFTAPLQWLTHNAVLAYNAAFIASTVLAGAGMYLLARELTGRGDAAAVAAVAFACQPFRISHVSHLQWLMTGWLPLGLWALHRYFRAPRAATMIACATFFVLQATSASYFAYFALLPLAIVGVWEWRRTGTSASRVIKDVLPAAVLVIGAMAPIARGYYDLRTESGLRRTVGDVTTLSADVGDYFSAARRLAVWGGIGRGRGEHELFVGALLMTLAVLGLATGVRRSEVRLYAVVLIVAFVCSLGPTPTAWGHPIGVPGPYAVLLRLVPGLDGLRAVARLAVVVQVALAVLAAFGSAWLFDRLRARARLAAVTVVVLVLIAEGWAVPMPAAAFNPNSAGDDREAYGYLRSLPAGAAIELPTAADDIEAEFTYQFMTLVHGHPVVNGHSSYVSPLLEWLGGGHSPLRDVDRQHDSIAALRGIGVRYLIVHRAAYADRGLLDALSRAIDTDPLQVIDRRTFGQTIVATLAPADEVPLPVATPIPIEAMRAHASTAEDRLPLLFDGDADSRWITGRPQSGDEWVTIDFDRPRNVAVVRLQLGKRSFGDYPRDLEIVALDGGSARVLFRGTVLPHLARGVIVDGDYPWIEIALPANQARTIRLRQVGTSPTFFWSIHELRMLARQ